jgi:hypothetical protein
MVPRLLDLLRCRPPWTEGVWDPGWWWWAPGWLAARPRRTLLALVLLAAALGAAGAWGLAPLLFP